jgi:uncharacterized protein (TIGR00369 family)
MTEQEPLETCFGCGVDNPSGLQLSPLMRQSNGELLISTRVRGEFEGYRGFVHGGISATLLDEAMSAFCSRVLKIRAVTGEITVRFLHPVPTETDLEIRANGDRQGRKVLCSGEIRDSSGKLLVEATGIWVVVGEKAEE